MHVKRPCCRLPGPRPLVSKSIVSRWQTWLSAAALCVASRAHAQQNKREGPEFTKQALLVMNFLPGPGADSRLGHRAADAVRSRVGKLINHREVDLIDGDDIRLRLERAGYSPDTAYDVHGLRTIGRWMRADEFVVASVSNVNGVFRVRGDLTLARDERLRQPLPDGVAPKLDSAAQLFAKSVVAARLQLVHQRRCENALREGSGQRALAAAREGITAYPSSTIARTCLVWVMRQVGTPQREVLAVSREILAVDSVNTYALDAAAAALDSLGRRDEAADMWFRLVATDTSDLDLTVRVSYALLDGGNGKRAEPFILRMSEAYPDELRLLQLKWRASYEMKNWPHAIDAGEALLVRDSIARADSTFYLRLGMAYQADHQPLKAIETLAHSVAAFPRDVRLYSLYTQYVKAEADTVVPRGLTLFPKSADLLALKAKDLRTRGKIDESLSAVKQAVALDSTMAQGRLMIAQLEMELGRPDSALFSLHTALGSGEDSSVVAQFALSKGNALYRAANATKTSGDFSLALRFLSFADSVKSSVQSKFLTGVSALGVAQAALTEASKTKEKTDQCRLSQLGADMLPLARGGLTAGQEAFADAAKQSLGYLDELDPYVQQVMTTICAKKDPPAVGLRIPR